MQGTEIQPVKNYEKYIFIGIAVATVIVWQLPFGYYILYPFTILGTWFHEMGHGITAIFLGGDFIQLEIFADGSGVATHTGTSLGNLGNALVAAGGPICPVISGAVLIISSKSVTISRIVLMLLGILFVLSIILWVRSAVGIAMVILFALVVITIALLGRNNLLKYTLILIGVQSFSSIFLSIGYLFSSGASIDGSSYMSDTGHISQNLILPHWFWAIAILFLSFYIMYKSLKIAFKNKNTITNNSIVNDSL